MRVIFMALVLIVTGSVAQSAFAIESESDTIAQLKQQMEIQKTYAVITGMKRIVQYVANTDLSCATGADCIALPIGSRACGGPSSFIVTSAENRSLEVLTQSIELVTKAERDANLKFGMMSVCSFEMPPDLGCSNNLCEQF